MGSLHCAASDSEMMLYMNLERVHFHLLYVPLCELVWYLVFVLRTSSLGYEMYL